ncbi:MAG: hypothetical protein ACLFVJ_10525 [Persicimonas sp.]
MALVGCSDDDSSGSAGSCPEGERFNDVTGECEFDGREEPNNSSDDGGGLDATGDEDTGGEPDADAGPDEPDAQPGDDCEGNDRRCRAGNVESCVDGQFELSEECGDGFSCSRGNCIPDEESCQPGASRCVSDGAYEVCESDGESYGDAISCEDGERCVGGECTSGCDGQLNGKSNLGCEYLSMRLNQASGLQTLPHTVVVSNPGDQEAVVSVNSPPGNSFSMADRTIQPSQSTAIEFPTDPMIDQPGVSDQVYVINTSLPVIATQFSPLNNPGTGSETSDASLLLPTNTLGHEHVVLGWPGPAGAGDLPGFPESGAGTYIDVVAIEDGTSIEVSGPAALDAGNAGSMAANSSATFSVPTNNVLHLAEDGGISSSDTDVSGTVITSNKPVAVYTGATIVNIPDEPVSTNPSSSCAATGNSCTYNSECCSGICGYDGGWTCMDSLTAADHVEQQLFPTETWGTTYVATPFYIRGVNDFSIYKVTASTDNTTIEVDPPVDGMSSLTLDRGEVHQFHTPDAFELDASDPIMVAQFMIGGTNSPSGDGDPAFLLPPAVEQFRDSYTFLVPDYYNLNFVTLIAPTGTDVELDGSTISASEFTPVGGDSNWSYKLVDSLSAGVHNAEAGQKFGIVVHGMDEYISYAFSGGITLPE